MATETHGDAGLPFWFAGPGEVDSNAWVAFAFVCLALYGIVYAYAAFERWAEHQARGTPLARTIPTLLLIALLYELFPLSHFHPLLPLTAVLLALMTDFATWMRRREGLMEDDAHDAQPTVTAQTEARGDA